MQLFYFQDSFALKHTLDFTQVPPGCLLATSDTTSMYTNIDSDAALSKISSYNQQNPKHLSKTNPTTLNKAMLIVFSNDIDKFVDTF